MKLINISVLTNPGRRFLVLTYLLTKLQNTFVQNSSDKLMQLISVHFNIYMIYSGQNNWFRQIPEKIDQHRWCNLTIQI